MAGKKDFVLVFDVPGKRNDVKVKVWRYLRKIKAKKRQHSVWMHDNLEELIGIAMCIKRNGGHAGILGERPLF